MSEKGSPVIMVALLFGLFWLSSEPQKDPTQCDIPTDSSALIETMREASKTLESSRVPEAEFANMPNHIRDATKMIDPQPSPSDKPHEKAKCEVLIFISKNCPPCEKWKRCEMQRFLDAGWAVGIVEVHSYPITPRYEIKADGKSVDHVGYITLEQAKGLVK